METKSAPVPSAGRLSCPKIAGEQPPRARFAHDHHLPRRSWNLRSSSHPVRLHTCSVSEIPMYHMTPRKTADCSPKSRPNQLSTCAGVKNHGEGRAGGAGSGRGGGARCTFPLISTCGPKSGSGSGGSSGAGASGTAADAAASSLSTGGAAASAPPSSTGASEATASAARACSGSAGLLGDAPPGTYAAAAQATQCAASSAKVAALDNLILFSLRCSAARHPGPQRRDPGRGALTALGRAAPPCSGFVVRSKHRARRTGRLQRRTERGSGVPAARQLRRRYQRRRLPRVRLPVANRDAAIDAPSCTSALVPGTR